MTHANEALTELMAANLLEERVPGRYSFHDLLRAYAFEQAHDHDDDAERRMAVIRALDHYLHTAHAAARLLSPMIDMPALAPPPTVVAPEDPVTYEQALAWFKAEHRVLMAAVDFAHASGIHAYAWQLPRQDENLP